MRTVKLWLAGLVVLLALSGCGQKGPLYREDPDVSARATDAVTAEPGSRDVRDDEDVGE
ncbi:lipoprotein [Marinobacter sp. M216]|uniref:Lipoprotein n=1 Tax=Marinobacter albus TaxID=3030833 RepID=A0ABT7HEP3_9GAMM|nr:MULTISPECIES: lipoprotein [unclassified Marinobacter]MBW7472243.1 lipoprotein [Marinobacter sp. F4218]MDK9558813.1 lipoprotein [Marinobacter sp. M216]